MSTRPALMYAQSGGMTAVINGSAAGVIATACQHPAIGRVLAARNGLQGLYAEDLLEVSRSPARALADLAQTPGGIFGSSRMPLPTAAHYRRLVDVLAAHDVRWFLHNGGGGSAAASHALAQAARKAGYPLSVLHLPKTVDNDLYGTDFSLGYASAARYIAISCAEVARDLAAMAGAAPRVFVLEVMGRHSGWLAAAATLATPLLGLPPLLLLPERPFRQAAFLALLRQHIARQGWAMVVVAEGLRWPDAPKTAPPPTGHGRDHWQVQTGAQAPRLAALIREQLGLPCHFAIGDYLQRSARHLAAAVDVELAWQAGATAVQWALAGHHDIMLSLQRQGPAPTPHWRWQPRALARVQGRERLLPAAFIRADGMGLRPAALRYLQPLLSAAPALREQRGLPRQLLQLGRPVTPRLPAAILAQA